MPHLSHRLAEAANSIRDLNEAGTRVSGQPLHWWQVINTHCGWTQPMSDMEVEKKTGVKPVFNRAMGKAMTEFVVKLTDGKTGPIIHAVIYQEQDGNTKGWDVAAHSSGQAQSAVISQVKAKMKQMGMPCNGKRPMTSKQIMSGGVQREKVEQGEEVTEGALNAMQKKLPAGVSLGKIIAGTQEWRGVGRNTNTKQSVVTLSAEIKKIGHMVGNPDPKTIDMIAKALIMHSKEQLTKKESVDEAVRLGRGRPAGAMTPAALFMHKFNQLENDNAHGAAALLLAKFMGQAKAVKCIELVNKIHETEGSIPYPVQQYRDQWSQRLWADFDKKYPKERFQ